MNVLAERSGPWLAAVDTRHSRRTFDGTPASAEQLSALASVCDQFRPYPDARVEFVPAPKTDVFRGAIGSYGKVVGAPHLFVVVAGPSAAAQQHAGYTGEACILEATALGLHTCWVGGFFSRSALREVVALSPDERAVAVSPVGHATDDRPLAERLMHATARSVQAKAARRDRAGHRRLLAGLGPRGGRVCAPGAVSRQSAAVALPPRWRARSS